MSVLSTLIAVGMRPLKLINEQMSERMIRRTHRRGEKMSPPPKCLKTRYEDSANGRVFFANEGNCSDQTVFYLHGGAFFQDFSVFHWHFLRELIEQTNAEVIAPAYRLIPFGTCRDALKLILPLYQSYIEANPQKKIILMGDSSGGGLAMALAEELAKNDMQMPDEIVLFSPWVDVTMENPNVQEARRKEPWLSEKWLRVCGRYWAKEYDLHDPRVSPVYGTFKGIGNVTVFAGTNEILYPDIQKMYDMLEKNGNNRIITGEGMFHVYPLTPIPEAKNAKEIVFRIVRRERNTEGQNS